MKSLKFLGVLLVSVFMPIMVNAADTAVINDASALEECIKTSAICQINANITVEDEVFNSGTIEIPAGKTLTVKGNTKVSGTATMIIDGAIIVEGVLDASEMQFGYGENAVGLRGDRDGIIQVKSEGVFISLDFWENVFDGGWTPDKGGHLFEKTGEFATEDGAIVVSGSKNYIYRNNTWVGAIKVGNENYFDLHSAVKDSNKDEVTKIEILGNIYSDGISIASGNNLVFDLGGNKITFNEDTLVGSKGTESQNMQLLKDSNITIKNGTLVSSNDAKMLVQNYSSLTLEDITLEARTAKISDGSYKFYALSLNNGSINIKGKTNIYSNEIAFDAYWWPAMNYVEGAQVKVNTTGKVIGTIEIDASGAEEESKTILEIEKINHEGNFDVKKDLLAKNVKIYAGEFTTDISKYLADKEFTRAVLKDGKYNVVKVYNVLKHVGDNGKLDLDKDSAVAGETVTMTVTPNEGYEIDTIKVIDKDNNVIEVKDNKFIMPNSEAWISVKFKPIQKAEAPVVDKDNSVGVSNAEKTGNILLDTLAKEDKYEDLPVTVEVVVEDIKASEEVKKEFTKALETDKVENGKIVSYFDITVAVKNSVTNKLEGTLTELTEKIEFTVALPELDAVKEGFTRKYYVIKKHGDKVEVINAKLTKDGKNITFETKEFSTYALAYEDVANTVEDTKVEAAPEAKPEVPQTADGITTTLILGALSMISVAGLYVYFKRETENR